MDWLPELQQIVGEHVRIEKGSGPPKRTGPFLHEEEWLPLEDGRYLVISKRELADETVELIRWLVKNGWLTDSHEQENWFKSVVQGHWQDAGTFIAQAKEKKWNIEIPAVLCVVELNRDELSAAASLLEEILSDRHLKILLAGEQRQTWLYVPLKGETMEDLQQAAAQWADTLSTELYLEVRLGISRTVLKLEDMLQARKQAEIALYAGKAYLPRQRIYFYNQLGYAHLLHGVSKEAKASFLNEVLPVEQNRVLPREFRETIQAFASFGQNIAETARALYIHRNTLLYRLDKIHEITGRDIRKFEDLTVLWTALLLRNEQNVQERD